MKFDILKLKYDGWNIRKKVDFPERPTPELAEMIGIMLGDGGIYLNKKKNYHTTIAFHKNEVSYLFYVKKLFEKFFSPYLFYVNELKDEYLLTNISKCVGGFMVIVGLSEGNKVKNKVRIPDWVFSRREFICRCIKGLFDTDGCVYRKYENYLQIQFKLGCFHLLESIREALIKLNFNPTKMQRELNHKNRYGWKIYLSRQNEIQRFFKEIKPMNKKHILRYKNIKYGAAGTFAQ